MLRTRGSLTRAALALATATLAVAAAVRAAPTPAPAPAPDRVGQAIDQTVETNKAAAASQTRVDGLDDQTRQMLERFRTASWQAQQLTVYANQLDALVKSQDAERDSLKRQLAGMETTEREILPLMTRMVDGLEKFVALDLPFLEADRRERVASLKRLLVDPSASAADKFKRILEAWQIEAEYGRTLGAERREIDGRTVDVLRVGRAALFYLAAGGDEGGRWNADQKKWEPLPHAALAELRHGLRMAHETAAPALLTLPMPAASGGRLVTRIVRTLVLLACALIAAPVHAQKGMDELLKQIQQGSRDAAKTNQEREDRFLKNRNEQAAALQRAEADFAAADARAKQMKARFEAGQADIAAMKKQLQDRVGDAGQMYTMIAQAAGEFRPQAADSLVAAQVPDRGAFLDQLAQAREIPSVADLEKLWFLYAQEAAESGKVARFQADVIDAEGATKKTDVVRVGLFTAFADGQYLVLDHDSGRLVTLPRQPPGAADLARAFPSTKDGFAPMLVDPSRGGLLRQLAERPTPLERVHSGGLVGYVIIALGAVGAVMAVFQLLYLVLVGGRVRRQLRDVGSPRDDNPLGRVLASLQVGARTDDPEVLETRLSEAVLRETPKLERFQSILRMIVAAGPLLGLLGTVVGMILTFQVLTEVGASDPKLMAGGISQAMIATVLGLMIAIPLLFLNTFLAARSRTLTQILDEQAAGLLAKQLEATSAQRRAEAPGA